MCGSSTRSCWRSLYSFLTSCEFNDQPRKPQHHETLYFTMCGGLGLSRIRILEASEPRSSRHSSFSEPRRAPPQAPKSRFIEPVHVLDDRPSLPLELLVFLNDFRSSRSSFGVPIALFFDFCFIILVCGGCFPTIQTIRLLSVEVAGRFPRPFL